MRTREQAIEILKANSEKVWSAFNSRNNESWRKPFAEAAIEWLMSNDGFNANGLFLHNLVVLEGEKMMKEASKGLPIVAEDKVTDRLRNKYKGTAFMKMV